MMYLGECVTDKTNVYTVGEDYRRKEEQGIVRRIFRKNFNHAEIIGEELCSIRNLSCPCFFLVADSMDSDNKIVPYTLAKKKGLDVKLGSHDFSKEGFIYFTINSISSIEGKNNFERLLSITPTAKNREELAKEICELFALDVYMGQADRFSNNVMFSFNLSNGEIHLASIFDFQYSLKEGYTSKEMLYDNQIYPFTDIYDFQDFIVIYPEFREMLKSYLDVDLVSAAKAGYEKRRLIIPDSKLKYYSDFDTERKKLIKKIIL